MSVLDRVLWIVGVLPMIAMGTAMLIAATTIGGYTILERVRRRMGGRRAHTKAGPP